MSWEPERFGGCVFDVCDGCFIMLFDILSDPIVGGLAMGLVKWVKCLTRSCWAEVDYGFDGFAGSQGVECSTQLPWLHIICIA